jgi:hypothetical protein
VALYITLPERIEAASASALVTSARGITSVGDAVLDATRVRFSMPYGIVTLGAAVLRRETLGLARLKYEPPIDAEAARFLREVGFDELVKTGRSTRQGTLAMRRVSASSMDPTYTQGIADLVERLVPNTTESVVDLVKTALNEMLQNVVEHAESTTDAVVLTRWYAREQNVRIAIADSGIGLAKSVRRNPKTLSTLSSLEVVRNAVTVDGTSGRVGSRFGGLGLKYLHRTCVTRGGGVHVTTHTVDAQYGPRDNRESVVSPLDGTTVEIDFRPGPDDGSRAEQKVEEFF